MMEAVLSNADHPEYGVATIPLPIPRNQYDHCVALLEALEIGDASEADCRLDSLDSAWPVLNRLVCTKVNLDELDYGDVLLQKTFTKDCISKKIVRNTGQLPMYLVTNNHQGIIDRQTFDAVQVEMARRGACKSPSRKNAPTGLSTYKSRYALSERLVCGECGTL